MTRPAPGRSRGFTLVELLVVLVIIAILVALLIPAIAMAVRTARSAAVQAEINNLAQALADFKSKHGDYPPSRILLNESGVILTANPALPAGQQSTDLSLGQLGQRSVTALRKFWPRVGIITTPLPSNSPSPYFYDFNGNGVNDGDRTGALFSGTQKVFLVEGQECLVFFLGGIPVPGGGTGIQGMSGFGKNPVNPFTNAAAQSNRTPPLYEFDGGRLHANANTGMAYYIDSINGRGDYGSMFAYFSTNLGAGYDPNDVNVSTEEDGSLGKPIGMTFTVGGVPGGSTTSPSPNPYTSTPPAGARVTFQNPQSFQIITPGVDGLYGVGGMYGGGQGGALPAQQYGVSTGGRNWTAGSDQGVRTLERDNLTNFHNGRLD